MTLFSIPWLAPLLVLCALAVTESGAAQQPTAPAPAASDARELVVLVHGMGRSRASMFTMGRALEKSGYRVVNFGYPYRDSIPGLGRRLGGARPSLEEVLALRADRAASVREVMAGLTDERLEGTTDPVLEPGYPESESFPVRRCLQAVVDEESLHRQFAERDLDALERRRTG